MADVLLATCAELPSGDEDGELLAAELERVGVSARWVSWTAWDELPDPDRDTLTVIRSTWDYTWQRDKFLSWARGASRIANAADVLAWNTDKIYLADLAAAGVPTVPTTFAVPGAGIELPTAGEFVVKPSVGAGSRGAGRFTQADELAARAHAAALHAAGRTVMVQPYLSEVDTLGETALVYVDGRFSHAVRKGAMLPAGSAHPVDAEALYVPENITACTPDPARARRRCRRARRRPRPVRRRSALHAGGSAALAGRAGRHRARTHRAVAVPRSRRAAAGRGRPGSDACRGDRGARVSGPAAPASSATGVPIPTVAAERVAALRRMKLVAGALLLAAAVVYVVCRAVGHGNGAWGYLQAAAEASMVGGLADWFAVTALFRHPLGLPIPHTAIIPQQEGPDRRGAGRVRPAVLPHQRDRQRARRRGAGARNGSASGWPTRSTRAGWRRS